MTHSNHDGLQEVHVFIKVFHIILRHYLEVTSHNREGLVLLSKQTEQKVNTFALVR